MISLLPNPRDVYFLDILIYAQKGYKLYDLDTHKIILSIDVIFHETTFPFHTSLSSSSSPLVTPTIMDSHPSTHYIPPFNLDSTDIPTPISSSPNTEISSNVEPPINSSPPRSSHLPSITLRKSAKVSYLPSKFQDFVLPSNIQHSASLSKVLVVDEPSS